VRRVAEKYRAIRWSTDYLEVVRGDIDAVVNLTPIGTHFPITLAALESGLHVYSEKPLAQSSDDARTLRDAASARSLVLVCAPSIMLFPQIVQVREILRSGEIGTVRAARSQALAGVPPWQGFSGDPVPYFAEGAGPLVDMGIYSLHVLTGLLGPVSSVAAMASRANAAFTVTEGPFAGKSVPVECEDEWQLLARLGSCTASVEANFSTVGSSAPDCEIRGDRGAVAFSLFDVSAPISILRAGEDNWAEVPVEHERESGPDHLLGVQHLVDCIQDGRAPIPSAEHAIHVLEVIEAARRAATEGRTVSVAPPPSATFAVTESAGTAR
jgi:predicted dehydrogenase